MLRGILDKGDIPEWAKKRIREAFRTRATSLNLNGFGQELYLTTIPAAVFKMPWLKALNLRGNQFTTVPQEISQLTNLESLFMGNNRLKIVPPEIGQLTNLTLLDLHRNQLTAVPSEIAQLTNLTLLDLHRNQLTAVPSGIAQLTNLTSLDLWGNGLTAVSLEIGYLTNLTVLDLGDNKLSVIPGWLVALPKLERLYLDGNPIHAPAPEVMNLAKLNRRTPIDLGSIRAYFRQLAEEGYKLLYEAKMIVLGEAGAGKTTLVKKLLNPSYVVDPHEPSTEGIDVAEQYFPFISPIRGVVDAPTQFRVNIWDFGGQEIYHATHKFFLTRRSLYVLVADAREQKADFYYWLNLVDLLGENSPALIIPNEKQNRSWAFNENQLRGEFSSLREVFPLNLADPSPQPFQRIINTIHHYLTNLSHVGDVLPKTWVRVRDALEADPRHIMPLDDYLALCTTHGFRRHDDKLQLSDYLHDLGVCLHFHDDPILKNSLILKPEWGTAAVYDLLESELLQTNHGQFSRADLTTIWHAEQYVRWRDELLQLMIRFNLCYPLGKDEYIVPRLLSENQPDYPWEEANNIQLRYRYPHFMPKGIITRFIVGTHQLIARQAWVWQTGVLLTQSETMAEIIEHYQRREITVRVAGAHKRDLLTIIRHEFSKIHADFPRLKFQQLIPCNCSVCKGSHQPHFFNFAGLQRRLSKGRTVTDCEESGKDVDIWSLIDDVGARPQIEAARKQDIHLHGDMYNIEKIEGSTGVAIGRQASSKVDEG